MATSKKVYVVLVEDHSNIDMGLPGDSYILGTFKSRKAAEKAAVEKVEAKLDQVYCERAYFAGFDEEFSWGNWGELPATEAEKTEDDTYSQEGVIDLIRKAGGEVKIETDVSGYYFETTINTQMVRG